MKRTILLGTLAGAAAAASAQSTVTLSGIADAAVRHVDNQGLGSVKSLVSGSNGTSRLIFRGSEDLGGVTASFHLETGIQLDTGANVQATQFFDRRATVSLASSAAGELRLGRDFIPSYVNWSRYDPFSYVGAAGANNLISATPNGPIRNAFGANPNTTVRSSNAVQYLLPGGLAGVEGALMFAFGEGGTAANGQHKVLGARLGWGKGPFGVSAAHTRSENNLTTAGGRFKDSAIGGNAAFGPVRLTLAVRRFEQGGARQDNLLVGAIVTVGAVDIKASYNKAAFDGRVGTASIDANKAQQFGLGGVYNLSKRSAIYTTVSRIDNDGAATYVVPGGAAGIAGGRHSTGVELGIRHIF